MKCSVVCVSCLALIVLVSSGCQRSPRPVGSVRLNKLFGGADAYEIVFIPALAHVRAYRLKAPDDKTTDGDPSIGSGVVVAGPVELNHDQLTKLTDILTDESTYDWDSAKGCEFNPDMAVRYVGKGVTVDFVFCFSCDEVQVWRRGKRVGGEDTDKRRADLVAIAKALFPDDAAIQALK